MPPLLTFIMAIYLHDNMSQWVGTGAQRKMEGRLRESNALYVCMVMDTMLSHHWQIGHVKVADWGKRQHVCL